MTSCAEFNFHADPEAASAVLRLAKCPVTIATWELSYKYNFVPLSWRKEILGKLDTSAARLINSLEEVMLSDGDSNESVRSGLVQKLSLGRQLGAV